MTYLAHATGPWSGWQRETHSPARQIVAPTGTIIRGNFPSVTARRMVGFEQLLERDALYLFDFAPQVVDIKEQPFKFRYAMGNKVRRYTPDYALTISDGSILIVEVKPARSLARPDVNEKLQHIRDAMQRQGHEFIVLTSDTIRTPHRLDNLKQLHRYLRRPFSLEDRLARQQLLSHFGHNSRATIGELAQELGNLAAIMHLVAHRLVSCDLDQPVTTDTVITLTEQGADYVFVNSL
ncbi:TnsA endonuclease N-terminal domain-containing protein [Aquitalea sp. LB_tupeE]|uniref:TnsA endonuclease N-terminal domain-containing protein n=1 Tax=Aquitalea sp. LB_tupeE TaxID=2748078 RepID=UPI0015B856D2|nr:TnsA endonuclease N-terminal domain-containing protein [Aquitalea sp. LB_tupeE]NWK76910.1 TnsA endonuclease N-terminal domain-containing protein [Aquitalea sp. LB_tupeE]